MTLDDIWAIRNDLRLVAFIDGTVFYVSLAHETADAAFAAAAEKQDLTSKDRASANWLIGEIVPDDKGQVAQIERR